MGGANGFWFGSERLCVRFVTADIDIDNVRLKTVSDDLFNIVLSCKNCINFF